MQITCSYCAFNNLKMLVKKITVVYSLVLGTIADKHDKVFLQCLILQTSDIDILMANFNCIVTHIKIKIKVGSTAVLRPTHNHAILVFLLLAIQYKFEFLMGVLICGIR